MNHLNPGRRRRRLYRCPPVIYSRLNRRCLSISYTEEHTNPAHRHPHDASQDFLQPRDNIFKLSSGGVAASGEVRTFQGWFTDGSSTYMSSLSSVPLFCILSYYFMANSPGLQVIPWWCFVASFHYDAFPCFLSSFFFLIIRLSLSSGLY